MGFFSRRGAAPEDGRDGTPRRVPMSSEVQANELRIKARRRLIGAVTLVLAAIIVLPMVLDSEPVPIPDDIIAIPERGTGLPPLANAGTAATAGLGM
ncbi:MAG: SPOR domain-containing protein, partial [Corticimicrobacter sp.]